jgi:N-acetylglucosamine malate deacetylase 2
MKKTRQSRLLVILAHPDDESFAVGGTLAKYAQQGIQVILLCATRGEAGIEGMGAEEAGAIREVELRRAAKHLGIEVHFLGHLDGQLSKVKPRELLEQISCWIDTVQPQVIITFGPDGVSGHPDHVTISKTVTQAVEQYFPKVCLLFIAPSEATVLGCGVSASTADLNKPLISVDISKYKVEKILAIQSHVSQHPPLQGKAEDEVEKIACHEIFSVAHPVDGVSTIDDCIKHAQELAI